MVMTKNAGATAAGTRHVIHLSTDVGTQCEHCGEPVGGGWGHMGGGAGADLAKSINHYLEKHGYQLLHVGTETTTDQDGNPWHCTIAVLGSAKPPPQRKVTPITMRERRKPK